MKIDTAIELLQSDLLRPGSVDKLDFQDAEQLGIEALKYYQAIRILDPDYKESWLPGETET